MAQARASQTPTRRPLWRLLPAGARLRSNVLAALTSERILPVGAVLLILVSAVVSLTPGSTQAAVGSTNGDISGPRLVVGGENGARSGGVLSDGTPGLPGLTALGDLPDQGSVEEDTASDDEGFLEDGTLMKPVVVDTSVADGQSLLVSYTVQQGDTLTGIASRFGVEMMTIWWANSLTSKDALKVGQTLVVPTVNGLVVHVAEGDTIEGLAGRYGIDPGAIIDVNGLEDPNLVIGQTLIMPGARGDGIAAPSPTPVVRSSGGSSTTTRTPTTYSGGTMRWPVVGGNYYISQYFHYGHYGLDIAADYGTPVVAASAGTVLFAGWKNNGGGYQVWLAHGSGIYTTYNHMSAFLVGRGESVGRGQQVGRVGMTGNATGPHLHFEVWIGPIWDGGYRVNPLKYL
jgi:murein DD-endopeptidase MepM/ murein hydrolase activator NlpD